MSIPFHCPECAESYDVQDDLAGKTIRCRECQAFGRVDTPKAKTTAVKAVTRAVAKAVEDEAIPLAIRYNCPFCKSERRPRKPILSWVVGVLMLLLGVPAALGYWIDNHLPVDNRLVGMIAAVGLCLGGTLILVAYAHRRFCPDCRLHLE